MRAAVYDKATGKILRVVMGSPESVAKQARDGEGIVASDEARPGTHEVKDGKVVTKTD